MNIQPIANAGTATAPSTDLTNPAAGTVVAPTSAPVPVTLPSVAPSQAAEAAKLSQALANINQTMQKMASGLEFSVDQESNRTIVKVVDQQTKELIRQMPSAEALEISKAMDRVQGLLISLRA